MSWTNPRTYVAGAIARKMAVTNITARSPPAPMTEDSTPGRSEVTWPTTAPASFLMRGDARFLLEVLEAEQDDRLVDRDDHTDARHKASKQRSTKDGV